MLTSAMIVLLAADPRAGAVEHLNQALELMRGGCRVESISAQLTKIRDSLFAPDAALEALSVDLRGAGISAGMAGCGPTVGTAIEQALTEVEAIPSPATK